ncbi:hypothetical protein KVF89_03270 [Nocardioides carbamazepini]|uniref:DUF6318 family protein n=1 Tax=Nocardioides carbamazepini TaxID=2854259 RepID=UPI00214A63FA|nr:DUF6318 family protein [Nocardioides carbamazepini]MCR1781543.1 hypothetical protein [Nocardioides carbamazepini]
MRTHRTAGGPPALGLLAATLALLLSAAACTGDDPDPRDPSSTWSPTGTMDPPSPTATELTEPTEPVLPDAAKQASEDGARAFITYYWDLINYAQATGDVKALKAASARTCDVCSGLVNDLRDLYRSGGHLEGGVNVVEITDIGTLTTDNSAAFGFRLELDISHDPQTIVRSDGSQEDRTAGTNRFTAYILWVDNVAWRTDALDLH